MFAFYGLTTCDTCRRARKALDAAGVKYAFHDVRDEGVSRAQVAAWAEKAGWETLLNRNSTTWRDLPHAEKLHVDREIAIDLMTAHPTVMKRPIVERAADVYVGWSKETEAALTKK